MLLITVSFLITYKFTCQPPISVDHIDLNRFQGLGLPHEMAVGCGPGPDRSIAMKRNPREIESQRWTGDPDYAEVEALPLVFLFGAIAFLVIGLLTI